MSHLTDGAISCGGAALASEAHLIEIAEILAAGLMRLGTLKSSRNSTESGERSLHFMPDQSGDAATCSPEVDA